MVELGELEAHHEEFSRNNTRIIASSVEVRELAENTQQQFPHLVVLADADQNLSKAVDLIHQHSSPEGGDTSAPTTILVDREGIVRWVFRPTRYIERISVPDLLAAVQQYLPDPKTRN